MSGSNTPPIETEGGSHEDVVTLPENKTEEKESFPEQILREAKILEHVLEAEYGFLEEEHDVVVYLNSRIQYLFPEEQLRVSVADNETEPNALSLPNGTIIVTRGLLELVETQDELDFVLAHEAMHFIRHHVLEINAAIEEAKKRYQTKAAVGDMVRILGVNRLAEYEADIRGVIEISKQKVNPAAARSVFAKLDEYERAKGLTGMSLAHGKNVARMVNVGAMAALFDSRATMSEQTQLPALIKEYTETATDSWLLAELSDAASEREIRVSVKRASLNEITLTLGRSRGILGEIEVDAHKRKQRENFEYFHSIVGASILEKIKKGLGGMKPEQLAFITQAVLMMSCGVRNENDIDSVFEEYLGTLDDISDETTLWKNLECLSPETFGTLGIVIPNFGDVGRYVKLIIQSANENELFVSDTGFDADLYVVFVKRLLNHFKLLSSACSFEPIHLTDITPAVVEEGILNLDLRKSNEPLLVFLQKLVDNKVDLSIEETMDIVAKSKQVKQGTEPEFIALVEQELVRQHPLLPIWRKMSKVYVEQTQREHEYISLSTKEKTLVQVKPEPVVTRIIRELNIKTLDELLSLVEYGQVELLKNDKKKKGGTSSEYDSVDLVILLVSLVESGADFLPAAQFERVAMLVQAIRLREKLSDEILSDFFELLSEDHVLSKFDPVFSTQEEHLAAYHDLIALVIGNHPVYGNTRPRPLHPVRLSIARFSGNDNKLLNELANEYYAILSPIPIDGQPLLSKDVLLRELQMLGDVYFPLLDRLPTPQVATRGKDGEYRLDDDNGFLSEIFERYEFSIENPLDQEILLYLAGLMSDPVLQGQLQSGVLGEKLRQDTSYDARLKLLFEDPRTKFSLTRVERESCIEINMQTHEECDKTEAALTKYGEVLADPERVGSSVVLELLGTVVGFDSKRKILTLCLESAASDFAIKKRVYLSTCFMNDQVDGDMLRNNDVIEADMVVNRLLSLDDVTRFAISRELLIGEKGLLLDPRERKWLLDYFFKQHIIAPSEASEQQLQNVLKEALGVIVVNADPDLLFFALMPLIHDRILRPAVQPTSWQEVLETVDGNDDENIKEKITHYELFQNASIDAHKPSTKEFEDVMSKTDEKTKITLAVKRILGNKGSAPAGVEGRLSVEKFMLKLVESMGAPGIRFLQIIGQYVELSPDLAAKFRDAYDRVKRQSKATSVHTMRREWPTFRSDVARVTERRGGGSLMTGYHCEMTDGSEEMVKVLNANAVLFTKETMRMLREAFDILVKKKPQLYGAARLALEDIEAWILEDIQYDRFIENDAHFRGAHHGKVYAGHDYGVHVPLSRAITPDGKDNTYVKVEEFIHGETLVRPEELEGHDMKQIVSVIIKNYFEQMNELVKAGPGTDEKTVSLVHADVHPGNFMAMTTKTGEKRVAIIDRNNFIELDERDRQFFQTFLLPQSSNERANALVGYLEAAPGANMSPEVKGNMLSELDTIFSTTRNLGDMVSDASVTVKKLGVAVPLKLTLLIKNFNGLEFLCRQAGFTGGIIEAFAYSPA